MRTYTDEEKAEEILQTKGSMTFCAKGCGYTEKVKELIAIGLAEGRKDAIEWHELRECPDDLPKCAENKQIIFYVKEFYTDIGKDTSHFCLGFYAKSFLNDDIKVFVEKSKGYECEHPSQEVIRWCELPQFKDKE